VSIGWGKKTEETTGRAVHKMGWRGQKQDFRHLQLKRQFSLPGFKKAKDCTLHGNPGYPKAIQRGKKGQSGELYR